MYDVLFKNVVVIDGSGEDRFEAEVAVVGDEIAAVGEDLGEAKRVVDGKGMVLAPGFIDIHTHSDYSLAIDPRGESKIRQGVTTEITGQCGQSATPLTGEDALVIAKEEMVRAGGSDEIPWRTVAEYADFLEEQGVSMNVGIMIGHGAVRASVMGFVDRAPTDEELDDMRALVRQSLEEGAVGLSTGLYYAPGSYADADEIVALCEVVAELATHKRDESTYNIGLIAAQEEVLDIARKSGVRTQISHLKALGPEVWGKASELLEMIEKARADGFDVMADQYPYVASGSSITGSLIPRWAQDGGRDAMVKRIDDPDVRPGLLDEVRNNLLRRGGADRLQIALYPPEKSYEGRLLSDVAKDLDLPPAEAALELLREAEASLVSFVMDEADVDLIMASELVMVGSDGRAVAIDGPTSGGQPHPRYFGTFPRVLGYYSRERGIIPLELAVKKMTSMPAERLRFSDRGYLRPGYRADLVLFDPENVRDQATFENPKQYPVGIEMVMVNGEMVIENGEHNGAMPGRVLRRS
ncbi:MAG: N-acyl-D-amino-acid deacylase family protein [Clostridia bacterium]